MFEAIWSALDCWQRLEAVVLMSVIVVGSILMLILNRDVRGCSK
jgi:hypothetical protein